VKQQSLYMHAGAPVDMVKVSIAKPFEETKALISSIGSRQTLDQRLGNERHPLNFKLPLTLEGL